jgi:hypothetical protein
MDIRWDIGRDFIRGGESVARFHSELDTASVHFLDSDGVGADGDLIGATEGCSMADIRTHFGAMLSMTAILSREETIADSGSPANAALRTRADFPVRKIAEIRQTHAAADLAEFNMAVTYAANHREANPAWAAEFLVVVAEDIQAAGTADVGINCASRRGIIS